MLLPTAVALAEAHPTAAAARHQEGQEAARPEVRPTVVPIRPEGPEGVHPNLAVVRRRAHPTRAVAAALRPAAPQSPEKDHPEGRAAAHRSQADRAAGRPTAVVVVAAARRWRFRRPEAQPRHL